MIHTKKTVIATGLLLFFVATKIYALSGVSPTGLNVRSTGPTTAFLTFQGTAGQTATDAFWCGEVTTTAVTATDPCVPGTLFGRLPQRNNFARASGTGGASNFTDIMTVPASVARRAFQDAKNGNVSSFFYVRKFEGAGGTQFIAVTCRLAGGGARTPLALLDVRPAFQTAMGDRPIYLFAQGEQAAPFNATVYYNGSGRLKGRWEVVMPGDQQPTVEDLLTEASLPVERRPLQRRYTVIGRFNIFMPPTGRVVLPGPTVAKIPTTVKGAYKILLRVEATRDKEGDSNTTSGVAVSGGVAGFPMPVLRYYVGTPGEVSAAKEKVATGRLSLMLPIKDAELSSSRAVNFSWVDISQARFYRLEVQGMEGMILSALVEPGVSSYTAPPWINDQPGQVMQWRVRALNPQGGLLAQSRWRTFRSGQ